MAKAIAKKKPPPPKKKIDNNSMHKQLNKEPNFGEKLTEIKTDLDFSFLGNCNKEGS